MDALKCITVIVGAALGITFIAMNVVGAMCWWMGHVWGLQ